VTAYGEAGNRYVGTAIRGCGTSHPLVWGKRRPRKRVVEHGSPRMILHTGSGDLGSSATVQRKTKEKESGGEETKAKARETDPTAILTPG
jgi:hypothetical protein